MALDGSLAFMRPRPAAGTSSPGGGTDESADPSADLVEQLLGQLEMETKPESTKPSGGKMFLGILGDALLAVGRARQGQPVGVGPFAASLAERERVAREQEAAAEAQNRDLRNRIRIGEFEAKRKASLDQ